jgi:hypothetical protein
MVPLRGYALLLITFSLPSYLDAQQSRIEIGIDGGIQYSFDANLFTIAVPFQRVRAAFPLEHRLAVEPALSFTRLSSEGQSVALLTIQVGALYDIDPSPNRTYVRPFAGIEYADASFTGGETVFDLGAGLGTRSRLADRLALRIEANLTGRFGAEGGTDGVIGATVGLSFFTRRGGEGGAGENEKGGR